MAFLLKSTKLFSTVIGFVGRRTFETGRRRNLFLEYSKVTNFYEPRRYAVSVAVKENIAEKESTRVEDLIYHLNRNIRYMHIFLQDVNIVLNAIKEKGVMTDPQFILLLRCCSEASFMAKNNERLQLAESIWSLAEELGIIFEISHYNALLSVYLDNNYKFNDEKFLKTLEANNIKPNKTTYRYLLQAKCQNGDIEGASQILVKMKELNYPLSEEDFNSLIQGHCQIQDFEKATELLKVMESRNLTPGSNSYLKLLLGYARCGKIEELNQLLDELSGKGISIRNPHLLEIIYELAVNNHTPHIESIKKRLSPGKDFSLHSGRIIQRLLHKKMDSLALKIFEYSISSGMTEEQIINQAKFILKHFVSYRKAPEVLNMCQLLEERGWTKGAHSFALREFLLEKNEVESLRFLNSMRNEGLEVRKHYYWPIIIKSSKRSPGKMRATLRRLPRYVFSNSFEVMHKVIFPNYEFRDLSSEMDFFRSIGVSLRLLNFCFLEKALYEKNVEKAEMILSTRQVTVKRWKHTINCMISCLLEQPQDEKRFLKMLKCFAHDFGYIKNLLQSDSQRDSESKDEDFSRMRVENIFDYAIKYLITRMKDEELIARVLEGMIENKMGFSSEAADFVASSFENEKIRDMAKKLTSPEVRFQFDKNLMLTKIWRISKELARYVSEPVQNLAMENIESNSGLQEFQSLGIKVSAVDTLFFALALAKRSNITEAFKVFETLSDKVSDFESEPSITNAFLRNFSHTVADFSAGALIEVFQKSEEMKIPEEHLQKVYLNLLPRLNLEDTSHLFSAYASKHNKVDGFLKLLIRACREKKSEALNRILDDCPKIISFEKKMTYYVIALAASGDLEGAKKVLQSEKVDINPRLFNTHCEYSYNSASIGELEVYLELVKNVQNFNRAPLYKLLLRKCAEKKDVAKALELCTAVDEEKLPDYDVLKKVAAFRAQPTPEGLQELAQAFQSDVRQGNEYRYSQYRVFKQADTDVQSEKVQSSILNAAKQGKISEMLDLVKENRPSDVRSIGISLLKKGRVEQFFQLLDQCATDGNFNAISNCFNIRQLLPHIQDDAFFEQYESLAIRCLEEGYVTGPLISLFVNSLKIPKRVSTAEAYAQQYTAHFRNVTFHEICQDAILSGHAVKFWENFVESEKLKSLFPFHYHGFYDKLINTHCRNGDLKRALHFLDKAVSESVGKNLDKNIISSLAEELKKKGDSFPYPELLRTC